MEKDTHQILVIEDDASVAAGLVTGLKKAGYDVELASDGERGVEMALASDFDLIILDLMLPDISGTEAVQSVSHRGVGPYESLNTPVRPTSDPSCTRRREPCA